VFALNIAVMLAYALTGRLGLLLAVPPGYATALWLPSGIAVGAVLGLSASVLPGIALGSFLANLSLTLTRGPGAATNTAVILSAMIGCGAAAQAWVGALLGRLGAKNALRAEASGTLARLILAAGPLACLIGASLGNFSLWLNHLISPAQIPLS